MNPIQQYLKNELEHSADFQPAAEVNEIIKNKGIEEYIFSRLMSKKFRKWKMEPDCVTRTKKAIGLCVKAKKPLHIIFPIGAYKLWRLPSSPEADWAEFFNITYVIQYLAPIAAGYKHGVDLTYYLHTLLMEKHDNLTQEEIRAYVDSFTEIISAFSEYLPSNLKINILRDADIYPREEYFKQLEEGTAQAKKTYDELSPEKKEHYHKLGALNIKWKGQEDWTNLSEIEKEQKIYQGSLYEMAATNNLPKVVETIKSDDKILLFTSSSKMFIGIGSTKTSMVKFWTGYGVLEKSGNYLHDRILSPSQLEQAKRDEHEEVPVDILPLKNLKKIRVYNQRFNFTK